MKLLNRTVIVTGAASGIGQGIAFEFANEGAQVVVVDLSEKGLDTVKEIQQRGGKAMFIQTDIRNEQEVNHMGQIVKQNYGKIDILINNAGVSIRKNVVDAGELDWNVTMDTNLKGAWLCCKVLIPMMIENGGGNIINISSTHSYRTQPNHFPYQSAKAGMIAMTNGICVDFGGKGIRANSISPGFIETPLATEYINEFPDSEKKVEALISMHPCQRLGRPEDVARTAVFLASDDSSYIYGANIIVDGGRSVFQKSD
jgi:3-oxoacyl-[acyl-carrier protein] reductase